MTSDSPAPKQHTPLVHSGSVLVSLKWLVLFTIVYTLIQNYNCFVSFACLYIRHLQFRLSFFPFVFITFVSLSMYSYLCLCLHSSPTISFICSSFFPLVSITFGCVCIHHLYLCLYPSSTFPFIIVLSSLSPSSVSIFVTCNYVHLFIIPFFRPCHLYLCLRHLHLRPRCQSCLSLCSFSSLCLDPYSNGGLLYTSSSPVFTAEQRTDKGCIKGAIFLRAANSLPPTAEPWAVVNKGAMHGLCLRWRRWGLIEAVIFMIVGGWSGGGNRGGDGGGSGEGCGVITVRRWVWGCVWTC